MGPKNPELFSKLYESLASSSDTRVLLSSLVSAPKKDSNTFIEESTT